MRDQERYSLNTTTRIVAIAFYSSACLFLVGCGPQSPPAKQTTPGPEASVPPVEVVANQDAPPTTIRGVVRWDGPRPKPAVLKTQGDPNCTAIHGDIPLLSDQEVVNDDGGVRFAFVYLENPPVREGTVPEEAVVLDQLGCVYTPHVLGVRVGQPLDITNSDPTIHNIRSFSRKNKAFNNAQPAGAKKRTKHFKAVEMPIKMKCDFHPWMTAYIFVMDHPFFAVTDKIGTFEIGDVPPGHYTLVSVHEKYGEQRLPVTVTDAMLTGVEFTYVPGG